MRKEGKWPGAARATSLRDEEVDQAYLEGRVTLLARDGQPWFQTTLGEGTVSYIDEKTA
jgi:hypothetical protein